MTRADRRPTASPWKWVVLLSALSFWTGALSAQDLPPASSGPAPPPGDSPARPDSLATTTTLLLPDSLRAGGPPLLTDSLATTPDSTALPADTLGLWQRLWRPSSSWPVPARYASPDPRPLPRLSPQPDRPSEDLLDELLPLVPGPLFDQAEVGHRQQLALDGLQARHAGLRLDGLELGSRITGLADLNLLLPGLCDPARGDAWNRQTGHAGGSVDFETWRARDDSVLTRVRWADGFLGYVHAEGEFARPLFGGRALAATRQTFTHQRSPGSPFRGNLFLWNWDKPVGRNWLLKLDQRLQRDASEVLDHDNHNRHLQQSLLRARLSRRLGLLGSLGLDYWSRRDKRDTDLDRYRADRERLTGLALEGHRLWAGGGWSGRLAAERRRLSSEDWAQRDLALDATLQAGWTLPSPLGRWILEPTAAAGHKSGDDLRSWHTGLRLGLTRTQGWGDLLLQAGATPPTAEQLHLIRTVQGQDAFDSPWLRASNLPLLPDSTLSGTTWTRQELRLGATLWQGRLPVSLRVWRVELDGDLLQTPASDSSWSWAGHDHVQWGAQLFAEAALWRNASLRVSQAWFVDNRDLVSREFPSYLLDGVLRQERRFFGDELLLRLSAGLHHEFGGLDTEGDPLWVRPEFWLQGEATRRRFTLWWAVRDPFLGTDNARVQDRPLHAHEEWLGVRWTFVD